MHTHSLEPWKHHHGFLGARHDHHARRTWLVVALTAAMMVAEIVGGTVFGSMALVADGWHMSTHAGALAIAGLAYHFARKHVHDPRFTFGTGKLGELAGFASAVILAIVALLIAYESMQRLLAPVPISFNEAIVIAVVGLGVNLASAWLLREDHDHGHHHGHDHHHHHRHHDSNLRAAYLHVLADALTSVLAIAALLAARFYGWVWMDPAVGIVGAVVIASWSIGLIRSAGIVLLDMVPDASLSSQIKHRLEIKGDRVSDLHLWRLGPGHSALVVSVVSDEPKDPAVYKARLGGLHGLSHVTVEVHPCKEHGGH
ncbi:CDF family Co(II)/Ni(II) efflux transporter DmeF [Bradyrhizobium sp. LHD-71]|uniref:CDF family Co(II)/Ni(II) efflux transporter DmeF n=1 Tax=Bradyrhizobium sp. LHD-71 TaxID=3072141 RepID=UPI00280EA0F0|nr:CDF family Co(II)/Ni(II) efflux transporter DmeF [Bradyrhizobium sp. LHD-71]MDQ8730707.1 CDF family Co(II)/Ni(II) efflux transporter DmeF [Bradyrhizobium sp. LHD-71]